MHSLVVSIITTSVSGGASLLRSQKSLRGLQGVEHIISFASTPSQDFTSTAEVPTKIVDAPGSCISEGFNAAIRRASGKYIFILNAGDELLELGSLIRALDTEQVSFSYGSIVLSGKIREPLNKIDKKSLTWHGLGFCHGAMLLRKSVHDQVGLYSSEFRIVMDYEFMWRVISAQLVGKRVGSTVAKIEAPGVSSNINTRTRENLRVLKRRRALPIATLAYIKWNIAARLAQSISCIK